MQKDAGYLSRTLFSSSHTPGDGPLHRLAVHWKIGLALLLAAGAVLGGWPGIAVLAAAGLTGARLSGYALPRLFVAMKSVFWFLLIAGLFPVLFTPGTPVQAFSGFPLTLTWEGLETGAQNTSRIALMFLISLLFIHTTHPSAWMPASPRQSRIASAGWRGWVEETLAVAGMAFQLLPLLCIEADRWMAARWKAGKDRLQGNVFKKARQAASWLVPLIVSVLNDMERIHAGKESAGKRP